jgi:hypothetical protein
MSTLAPFQLRMKGLDPATLIPLEGERGTFYVCKSGMTPEAENGIFYGDTSHQFCFFTHAANDPPRNVRPAVYDLEIYDATSRRLDGILNKMPPEEVRYIERNIEHMFRTRQFFALSKPIEPDYQPREIRFTWKISL